MLDESSFSHLNKRTPNQIKNLEGFLIRFVVVIQGNKQQQQQCIYLQNYKIYNTLCPANRYNANLGRTKL